jgi:2-phosphosulfolactate phosphatase
MTRLHVVTRKEDLDPRRLAGKTVVVLDVLFATSTIVTALAHGAREVYAALDGPDARAEAARRPAGACVFAGEDRGDTISGFESPFPLALAQQGLAGRTLVYATTNGTVALRRAAGAARVYAAALLNASAVVERVCREGAADGVLLVCAGSADRFSLEDWYGAGYVASLLGRARPGAFDPSDAAIAAQVLHDRTDALEALSRSAVGRWMTERGHRREVAFAAEKDRFDVVPELCAGPPGEPASSAPVLRIATK